MVFTLQSRIGFVFFLEEASFSSLSLGPSTKALHNVYNIGLNKVTNYYAALKQGIKMGYIEFWSGRPPTPNLPWSTPGTLTLLK